MSDLKSLIKEAYERDAGQGFKKPDALFERSSYSGNMWSTSGRKTVAFQDGGLTQDQKDYNANIAKGNYDKSYKAGTFQAITNPFTHKTTTYYIEDCNCNCSRNCNCSSNCNCTHNCNCDSYGGCYMFGGKGFRGNGISSGFTFVYCNSAPNYDKDGIIAPDTEEEKK